MTATLTERAESCTATKKQLNVFEDAIRVYLRSDATITGSMDEDGTMIITVEEDGATSWARFKRNGLIEGDWVW